MANNHTLTMHGVNHSMNTEKDVRNLAETYGKDVKVMAVIGKTTVWEAK